MELQGKIIAVLDAKTGVSARGEWKVQEFVLETNEAYPKKMVFSVFGDDRLRLYNIQQGQDYLVRFDIDAHEYNGRWFNSIRAFDVRPATDVAAQAPAAPAAPAEQAPAAPFPPASEAPAAGAESQDDLPF